MSSIKPQLIILPGWGGDKRTWKSFCKLAQRDFAVTCIELPCFGEEACPKDVWGIDEYATFVQQKIKALPKSDHRILLGHSFGGQVAAVVAAQEKTVTKLILIAPAIIRPKKYLKRGVFGTVAKIGKVIFSLPGLRKFQHFMQKILYKAADSPDYAKTKGIKQKIFQRVTRQDARPYLTDISVPVLLISGDKDTYVPLRYTQKIAPLIPQCRMSVIAGGRHGLHHKKSQTELYRDIHSFVFA